MDRRRTILVGLLLLVLSLALSYLWLACGTHSTASGYPGGSLTFIPSNGPRPTSSKEAESAGSPGKTVVSDKTAPSAVPSAYTATIRLVTPDAAPIAGLEVKWFSGYAASPPFRGEAETDDLGEFAVAMARPGRMSIESPDQRWFFLREHQLPADGSALVVVATPCVSISVQVLCESGEYYTGRVILSEAVDASRFPRYRRSRPVTESVPATFASVPVLGDLYATVEETMISYGEFKHLIRRSELVEGACIRIVLPRGAPSKGQIDLDLSGYSGVLEVVEVREPGSRYSSASGSKLDRRRHWISTPLSPGVYIVRVKGRPDWELADVVVRAGEVTAVQYQARELSAVTVRVVNSQSQVIERAALSRDIGGYFRFDSYLVPERGITAFTGADGIACLTSVGPGRQKLIVEAEGFEPHFLEVILAEGEVFDYGNVVLQEARGRIVVRLVGAAPGNSYLVALRPPIPPGGAHFRRKLISGTEHIFDNVPLRLYEVIAAPAPKGGTVASQHVTLTPEQSEMIVELDVSQLQAKR